MSDPVLPTHVRLTIEPSDERRTVRLYHDGDHEVWVDGVLVYSPPTGPTRRPTPRRSPLEWVREHWFYFRNGTPRGL